MSAAGWKPAVKAGQLTSGAQADHGHVVHLVPDDTAHLSRATALCGTQTGKRSVGWATDYGPSTDVTCTRCASKARTLARQVRKEVAAKAGERRAIPLEDWLREGRELFESNFDQWPFVCPRCGQVQTAQDFVAAGDTTAEALQAVWQVCIGRREGVTVGCDWTLGGLLQFHETEVITDTGNVPVFEFAKESTE